MEKMWAGRSDGSLNSIADDFNSSIGFDCRMYRQDIKGSLAHAAMLAAKGIISERDCDEISAGLEGILADLDSGALKIDPTAEDIHMFVESVLTERIGEAGKRLHTARSRNDQVALDIRLYIRDEKANIRAELLDLISAIRGVAAANQDAIMPGYTHLQRAQPIVFAQQLLAYAMMFTRDVGRLDDMAARMNYSPLGSCALAGTTYDTDRYMTAAALGFDGITQNSIDGVSDRDFCIELLSDLSIIMMHLSRFAEELILWSSWEFRFVELSDDFTTGSSIMPQKKNSDMAELTRGKTGRVYGDLVTLLTLMKGLPLAYNKDMQEDKEAVFDGIDTVRHCLEVFAPMVATMKVRRDRMYLAAQEGFINATDLADYMVTKGLPFRSAYKIVGQIVAWCGSQGKVLDSMTLDEYRGFSPVIDADVFETISLESCVRRRLSAGGTGPESVKTQIEYIDSFLRENKCVGT